MECGQDDPAATHAIDQAHEARMAPAKAVESVVGAVTGIDAAAMDAKRKNKGKKKGVTCTCM